MSEIEELIEDLRGGSGEAARKLAESEDASVVPAMIDILINEPANFKLLRKVVFSVLKEIGYRAVPSLIDALENESKGSNYEAVENIAWALGEIGDERAVPALIDNLKPRKIHFTQVLKALGKIGDSRAVPALIDSLTSDHCHRCIDVGRVLGAIGDIRAVPALIDTLGCEYTGWLSEWEYLSGSLFQNLKKEFPEWFARIIEKCDTYEKLEGLEDEVSEGAASFRRKYSNDNEVLARALPLITKLSQDISRKKRELAANRGLHLEGRPRPPKPRKDMWQTVRKACAR